MTTAERAVETFARKLMARGELVTWDYDAEQHAAILYVPPDVDITMIPPYIGGVSITTERLPRPVPFAASRR